jgi:tetratricopeptide (TPR) repeat protein
MPQHAEPIVWRSRVASLGLVALLFGASTASATSSPSGCDEQCRRIQAARDLERREMWEEAARVAARVELLPGCWLHYVQAQSLLGWVLGQHLGRLEEAVASYRRGLHVDRRQSLLWYELGYLLYSRSDYPQAMEALENALIHVQTTPPNDPERFTMFCRLLYAESADRLAMLSYGAKSEHVERAVSSWHDYEDFCEEYGHCEPQDLKLAAQRLQVLRSQFRHGR